MSPDAFLQTCLKTLPNKTIESIKHHHFWYEQFLQLKQANKEAIARWKTAKSLTKPIKSRSDDEHDKKLEKYHQEIEAAKQKKKKEAAMAWREAKNLEKLQQDELERVRQEKALAVKREIEQKKRLEIKEEVEVYREKKRLEKEQVEEAEARIIAQAHAERQAEIKQQSYHFQARDVMATKKMMYLKNKNNREKAEKEQRILNYKNSFQIPVAKSDPERLTKLTKSAQSRVLADKDPLKVTVGSRNMPRRATPSWRAKF